MRLIRESSWKVTMMTSGPNQQVIEKQVQAPNQQSAIQRAQSQYPNQTFVQVTATALDQQTNAPTANAQPEQQTTMSRMRGLRPLRTLMQPGQQFQQATESVVIDPKRFSYPYSITLPYRFYRLLGETSPVPVMESLGQFHIVLEDEEQMREFLTKLNTHSDRDGVRAIVVGIRSSLA